MTRDIQNVLDNGFLDENPRPKYSDGTPAHTFSVNHVIRKYDLGKEFPILSLRKIAWKTGIKELFAIYQNQSNKISEFERLGCRWWQPWSLADGTIGKAYPYNLESHRPNEMKKLVKKIKRKTVEETYKELKPVPTFEKLPSEDDTVYLNRYRVVGLNEQLTDNKHVYYNIQFISNNYVTFMRKDIIGKSKGINPYDRTTYGVGYLDFYNEVENFTQEEITILKDKWENMFRRCYSEHYGRDHPTYKNTFVHQDWHSFKQFLEDVRYIPQYFLAREENFNGWDLDKDYYGSNAYSKETCVFLKHSENTLYAKNKGYYKITNTLTNEVWYEINISEFARHINKRQGNVQKAVTEKGKYLNYLFEYFENDNDHVYRYELSRNQIIELLKDIESNPYGRRHIISFWNWANIDKKSLVECAYETIWNVRQDKNGKKFLDMMLIQRSGDMLTASGAGSMNEVQYAALQMMIARHTGYEPGIFTHVVANEQIYDRHVSAAKLLLERFEKQKEKQEKETHLHNPRLILNPDKKDFYDITIDDFEMVDYEPVPGKIELDLGI